MPGIVGFVKNNSKFNIDNMTESMLYSDKLTKGDVFSDKSVVISEVKLNCCKNKFIHKNNLIIFVNGKCFNLAEINKEFNIQSNTIEELFYEAYKNNLLDNVLNKLNGFFSAVIYDKKNSKINLISDRRGTRFLYYYIKDKDFAFGAEVKSLVSLREIDLAINKKSFDCFMELGYLLEDATWFENIRLIKPSSILEFDINTGEYSQRYYWKFSEIKRQNISFKEAVDKLAELLPKAVTKMYSKDEVLLIPLSGGLDSRVIASSLYEYNHNIKQNIVTFGQKGCRDIEIASKIAKQMNQSHKIYDITIEDVISDRKKAIWYNDGLYSIQHAHSYNIIEKFPKETTVVFSGAAGGEIYGACYEPNDKYLNKTPCKKTYENIFKNQTKLLNIDDYYNLANYYPIVIDNALRKFSLVAMQFTSSYNFPMLPFFENDLIDFILSIPDEYKKGYKLYWKALLKAFPYWYKKIPSQSAETLGIESWWQKRKRKFKEKIKKIFKAPQQIYFFDYYKYVREDNVQKEMEKILDAPNDFIEGQGKNFVKQYKDKHWDECKYNADIALKLVSVKLYFDKVKEIIK